MTTIREVFPIQRYIFNILTEIERFCLYFPSSSIKNHDVTRNDLLNAIDDLERFERSARIFDRRKGCKHFQLQSLIILVLNSLQASHFLLLSITDNETIRFYAGDIFVSSSERKVLNYIVHVGIIIPCMVKIFLIHHDKFARKSFINIFDEYKESLEEYNKEFILLSTNEKSFRKSYYFLIKLYNYFNLMVYIVFGLAHTSTVVLNYSSLKPFIIQLIHTALLLAIYYLIISSALWFLFIMILVALLACNSIDSLTIECGKLNSINHYNWTNALTFYYKINLLNNWIDCFNAQVATIFMAVYIYAPFHNILIFFYLTQFTFDNLGVKILLISSNILILIVLYASNYLGTLIGQKGSLLHLSIYRVSVDTGGFYNLKVALKKLQVLERFEARKIGAYIGNYIYVNNNNTLILTLECASLYFLFCANINRNTL
uniref:Gustatory receptor n=1 Tax=Tetranychus urticae TaxID=32264 RepID=T1KCP1_TETUR